MHRTEESDIQLSPVTVDLPMKSPSEESETPNRLPTNVTVEEPVASLLLGVVLLNRLASCVTDRVRVATIWLRETETRLNLARPEHAFKNTALSEPHPVAASDPVPCNVPLADQLSIDRPTTLVVTAPVDGTFRRNDDDTLPRL